MLIQVMYPDNNYDYVKDFILNDLIETEKIVRFRRRTGWISLGVDPVRSRSLKPYQGEERRHTSRLSS